MHPLRNHKSYIAFVGHRLSGIALAIFLPFHLLLLANAFDGADGLDSVLVYTDQPLVKIAESGLVMMLALHLFFGIRVLLLELTVSSGKADRFTAWVLSAGVAAAFVGIVFLIQVF